MAGRIGVKKEDVFLACEELMRSGQYVTIANVRSELGTGSYGTLAPLVSEWKKNSEIQVAQEQSIPAIPVDLMDLGQKFISDIWTLASSESNKKLDELNEKHKSELEKISIELKTKDLDLHQAIEDIKALELENESLNKSFESLKTNINQKEGEIKLLKEQLEKKESEVSNLLERAVRAEKDSEFLKRK